VPPIRQRVCRWCSSLSNDPVATSCTSCGGPLPALPARLLRDNPELVVTDADFAAIAPGKRPRRLPAGYFSRHLIWKNFGCLWGSIWVGIGALFLVAAVPLLIGFPPMGGIFCLVSLLVIGIGVFATLAGMWAPWRKLMALRSGLHAQGTVVDVREDRVDFEDFGFRITYVFETANGAFQGVAKTTDWLASQREEGERIWVVYRPGDPTQNTIWPPV